MPSIVTHHLFAKDCLKKTNIEVDNDIYFIFAQSFDNLFYYKFFTPFLGKKIRRLGNRAQREKINDYFLNILIYIKNNNLQNNKEINAYLMGSICHYALDTTCHPYIIYNSGITNIDKKYRGGHEKMEVMIDAILYEKKTHQKLKDANLSNTLLPLKKFSSELKNIIDTTFQKTFAIENIGTIYEKSYKTGHFILKYFVTDHTGIKKKMYQIKDYFSQGKMYQYLSFHINSLDKTVLNEERKTWYYPTDNTIKRNDSFTMLYTKAIKMASNLMEISQLYLKNKISIEIVAKEFKNLSYSTGKNWLLQEKPRYFKPIN